MKSSSAAVVSLSLALLVGSAHPLTPDGGKWHQPGSPFTVRDQIPTRHVAKEGTKLQSDPYGMPSYGQLHVNAYDDGYTSVVDFGRPSYYHHEAARRQAAASAGAPPPPEQPQPQPPQEPQLREFERQQYFRSKEDWGRPGNNMNQGVPPVGGEEDYFFAGGPNFGWPEHGMPSFFQQPPSEFSFAGRPSTSFHQRPLRPNFY